MNNVNEKNKNLGTCNFFLKKKKRYCHLLVNKNLRYCGQHLVIETNPYVQHLKRIPCPLDSKHSVFANKLEKHLKTCNAREKSYSFLSKGINAGELLPAEALSNRIELKNLDDEKLMSYLALIERTHKDYVGDLVSEIETHKALQESLTNEEFGSSVLRHLRQNASILGHLEKLGLMNKSDSQAFIEFGAGRGQLTKWIIDGVSNTSNSSFILVDKGSQRHKFDAKLKHIQNLDIKRVRIDIQDLDLTKLDAIKPESSLVVSGKHLCGAATDFTLRCLSPVVNRVGGIIIALCCHHRCSWQSYVGKEFLMKIGFTSQDFPVLVSLSSWAVSGSRTNVDEEHHKPDEANIEIKENRYQKLGMDVKKREVIGRKTKQLLDWGRIEYLRGLNLSAKLVQYVASSETLENIALVAFPNEKPNST